MAVANKIKQSGGSADDLVMSKKRLLLLLPAVGLLAGACSAATSDASTRDEDGVVIEGGDVGVLALNVGDCFDDPPGVFETDEVTEIETVVAIPCDEPHDNQAYAKFDLPDGDWPGDTAATNAAFDGCLSRFESMLGEPYETSPLDILPLSPTRDGWSLGDHEVLCAAYNVDLSKMTEDVISPGA